MVNIVITISNRILTWVVLSEYSFNNNMAFLSLPAVIAGGYRRIASQARLKAHRI